MDLGHFILMDGRNSIFHLINTFFFIFGCCPKNLAIAKSGGYSPPAPSAHTPMSWLIKLEDFIRKKRPAHFPRMDTGQQQNTTTCLAG